MPSFGADGIMRRQILFSVQAQGQQYITDLESQLTALDGSIQGYKGQLASGAITQQAFTRATSDLLAEVAKLTQQLDLAKQALAGKNIIPAEVSSEFKNFGFTVLAAGHALQDLQYGVGAVVNNIPQLAQGMSQAAGVSTAAAMAWAGGLTIVATAANVLYNNWSQVEKAFQGGIPRPVLDTTAELERKLKDAKKVTEDLGKESTLTVSQMTEYKRATAAVDELTKKLERAKELEDLLAGQSKGQRERGSAFREAIAESGGDSAKAQLVDALSRGADAKGLVYDAATNTVTNPTTAAENLLLAGGKGDYASIEAVRKALRDAFGNNTDFGQNIFKFSPQGEALAKQGAKHGEILDQMNDEIVKAEEQAADKRKNALVSYWVGDEQKAATALEQGIERQKREAERAAEKKKREQAQALDRMLTAEGKIADANAKDATAAGYAQQFVGAGFNQQFAKFGGDMVAQRVKRGQPEDVALNAVYMELLKTAATQEKTLGMLGEATARLAQLQQHNQLMQQQINQLQGNFQRMRNRKPSLLPHPAVR